MKRLPHKVTEQLGWYVYLYVNPFDGTIFYVGKGKGNRLLAHLHDQTPSSKTKVIQAIQALDKEPRIEILAHGLSTEVETLRIESAAIALLGVPPLTNEVRGYDAAMIGRIPLDRLIALYTAKSIQVAEPALLIRINRRYRYDMSKTELYEATRGIWKVGRRREAAELAIAIYKGVVREVYRIEKWLPAGTTQYITAIHEETRFPGRWEFIGRPAEEHLRDKYLDRSVADYFPKGSQNPILYVNC
ncbi:MAG TPA: hypothetical protein VJ123_10500 [Anaerolineales bacterium]|nr:hypothetical protein [Anaerolineales bacterium]